MQLSVFRLQRHTWEEPCALDQGEPFFMLKIVNLLSCKGFFALICVYPIDARLFVLWIILDFVNTVSPIVILVFFPVFSRYGTVDFVDERHRHRYEVGCYRSLF